MKYYLVRAIWENKDKSEEFISQNIWSTGYKDSLNG